MVDSIGKMVDGCGRRHEESLLWCRRFAVELMLLLAERYVFTHVLGEKCEVQFYQCSLIVRIVLPVAGCCQGDICVTLGDWTRAHKFD